MSGQVLECRLVLDPRTRESRGFGFVTMDHLDDAERCIKYLNRSTLEGRMITVEKVSTCGVSDIRIINLLTTLPCLTCYYWCSFCWARVCWWYPLFDLLVIQNQGPTLLPQLLYHLVSSAATLKLASTNPPLGPCDRLVPRRRLETQFLLLLPCVRT